MTVDIAKVVSTCILRDIEVWKVAAPRIINGISAAKYEIVVPDAEIDLFRRNAPDRYEITPESRYAQGFDLAKIRESLPDERKDRAGWYLQQFLKLEACRVAEQDEDVVLIWDADTIPTGKLRFVTPEGQLLFRMSGEFHAPYFTCIEKLIGLPRLVTHSFIAQCFPTRVRWVKALASAIEARHGVHYFEAILRCAEKSSISGFSEYETLGTFAFHHFNKEVAFSSAPWLRNGKSVFGNLQAFERIMALEYVTFEHGE